MFRPILMVADGQKIILYQSIDFLIPQFEGLGKTTQTGIQRASKVRSSNGLLIHVFGRLAAAMWLLSQAQSA